MKPRSGPLQCVLHPQREAAARCVSCGNFFCRECITEHDLRMLCAHCLRDTTGVAAKTKRQRHWHEPLAALVPLALGIMLLWFGYYLLGRLLLAIPEDFHEGNIWSNF